MFCLVRELRSPNPLVRLLFHLLERWSQISLEKVEVRAKHKQNKMLELYMVLPPSSQQQPSQTQPERRQIMRPAFFEPSPRPRIMPNGDTRLDRITTMNRGGKKSRRRYTRRQRMKRMRKSRKSRGVGQ